MNDYQHLKQLADSHGYKLLQALWSHWGNKLMKSAQTAASKGNESAWRFYAGQLKGFEIGCTTLDLALKDMEEKGEDSQASKEAEEQVKALLEKIKGEDK